MGTVYGPWTLLLTTQDQTFNETRESYFLTTLHVSMRRTTITNITWSSTVPRSRLVLRIRLEVSPSSCRVPRTESSQSVPGSGLHLRRSSLGVYTEAMYVYSYRVETGPGPVGFLPSNKIFSPVVEIVSVLYRFYPFFPKRF